MSATPLPLPVSSRLGPVRDADPGLTIPMRALMERSSDAFVVHDFMGRRVYSNPAYLRLVGREVPGGIPEWGPFPDWAAGTAKEVSIGMRRAREAAEHGLCSIQQVAARLVHPSGQHVEVTMQLEVVGAGRDALGVALVKPLRRVPWMDERSGDDARHLRALEEVIRTIALELSRVGIAPVSATEPDTDQSEVPGELASLSAREWRILQEILAGRRVPMIATHLNLSQHTVRNHLKSIFRKLGVHSQSELVERYRAVRGRQVPAYDPARMVCR